jgi:hypothetical protein
MRQDAAVTMIRSVNPSLPDADRKLSMSCFEIRWLDS